MYCVQIGKRIGRASNIAKLPVDLPENGRSKVKQKKISLKTILDKSRPNKLKWEIFLLSCLSTLAMWKNMSILAR